GRKTVLHLATSPDSEEVTSVPVKPISDRQESGLFYDRWVNWQRDLVHQLSNGQLGYVHIARQDGASLAHFKHHLGNENVGRKGMVIDVRFNGAGSTAVHQLEILFKKQWLMRMPRGGDNPVSENIYRSTALEKPSCLLINGNSFSNAEILAEGFRHLKIGPIIGEDTGGGVIGTSSATLIDGSRMRLPLSGAWAMNGENLENNGRKPDFLVANHPADLDSGKDAQTAKAVEELLKLVAE
ncbi:MAG: biopolymer transporter Tol, partial [Planctomycetes bacterium]|nr:biopolymer transporter Tol [Planctomycetota bacterium]